MDRKQFGKLVAALRQEMGWTQSDLAQYTQLDVTLISQIERGVKKFLPPDMLVSLADCFQLTTLERKEFFFASTGIESRQIVRGIASNTDAAASAGKSLDQMVEMAGVSPLPAFVMDVYADVLAINYIAFAFFQVPLEMMANALEVPGGMNAVRLVFGKDLAARTHFLNNWDYYAISTMRFFRETSLCYRAHPYFHYLMKHFHDPLEYPLFERFWRMISSVEQDREGTFENFSYDHDLFGHLSYSVATTMCVTAEGELFMNQYIPTDAATKQLFDRLALQNGTGVIRGAPWPVKHMP